MSFTTRKPAWSDLPQELLSAIANSLTPNPLDILVFRSVCNSWRSSFPRPPHPSLLSPRLPLSVPRPPFSSKTLPFFLTLTRIYAVPRPLHLSERDDLLSLSSPASWVLFLDEFNPGRVSLRKPFSRHSCFLPITFPKTINLIDFNARELGRFYNLSFSDDCDDDGFSLSKPRFCYENCSKFVLFPDGMAGIVLFDDGKLGLIRLDLGINKAGQSRISEWEIIHDGEGFLFDDIVEFKGRILGIDRRARVYEIRCHSSLINPVFPTIAGGGKRRKRRVESSGFLYLVIAGGGERRKRLVESSGFLYLVMMCRADKRKTNKRTREKVDGLDDEKRETKFKVYKLDEGRKKWMVISSIGDRSFFIGVDFSFSASARELGTCGKNSIVFNGQSFQSYNCKDDDDMVIPGSKSGDIDIAVCYLNNVFHFGANGSYPGYSDLLWPPPSWIWSLEGPPSDT